MNVIYTEKAKKSPYELVNMQRATTALETIVGSSERDLTVTWDRDGEDRHSPYVLRISDWAGEVSERFAADALHSDRRTRSFLRGIWGDLLEIRSHKLFNKLIGGSESAGM